MDEFDELGNRVYRISHDLGYDDAIACALKALELLANVIADDDYPNLLKFEIIMDEIANVMEENDPIKENA